jgi:DNA repair exonuclease SbcCD nuclease subunit
LRFIHTADWQIGMRAAHVGAVAQRVRDERLQAIRRLTDLAREKQAEFLVLAGDTFEDNGISPVLIQQVADLLGKFVGPVYLLPGNHDPLVPGSVWEHPAWTGHRNLNVLRQAGPIEVPGGTLWSTPLLEKHSRRDPTLAIQAAERPGIQIGVSHGTVEGVSQDEPDYPIAANAAVRAGLDYLALGHWHSTVLYPDREGCVRMAYSGTHETTKFGERDSGNALLVEIGGRGTTPRIEPLRTGALRWEIKECELRESGELEDLRRFIEQLAQPELVLLDVRLSGLFGQADLQQLKRLRELSAARLMFARWDESRLRPAPEHATWWQSMPQGPVRQAAERLHQLSDPGFAGTRPEGATVEVAARALVELFALSEEVAA